MLPMSKEMSEAVDEVIDSIKSHIEEVIQIIGSRNLPFRHKSLIDATSECKDEIPYLKNKIDFFGSYKGLCSDFGFTYGKTQKTAQDMKLDLNNDADLFLLFVLAIARSRPEPWQNAEILTAYLKHRKWGDYKGWINSKESLKKRIAEANAALSEGTFYYSLPTRVKVVFRCDIFASIAILAENWTTIKGKLDSLRDEIDEKKWIDFMGYLNSINGLGDNGKNMLIGIPLILRELKYGCDDWANIQGRLCCVPDDSVIEAARNIVDMPDLMPYMNNKNNPVEGLIHASEAIYDRFDDLYEIPLLAFEDIISAAKTILEKNKQKSNKRQPAKTSKTNVKKTTATSSKSNK